MAEAKGGAGSARQKPAAFRLAEQRAARRRRALIVAGAAVVAIVVVVAIIVAATSGGSTGPKPSATPTVSGSAAALGPEGIPLETGTLLASASGAATGSTVDGVQCNTSEQVAYHIHTHLAVYVNGALRPIPPGIGIVAPVAQQTKQGAFYGASRCYYWLHVHAQDGVIHIEAPSQATYTLGQFFAIWGQPLSSSAVAGATGKVTVYVDGKAVTGDPSAIVLRAHEVIQLDVGTVVAPRAVDWSTSSL